MANDRLELLIGRLLDGELSRDERRDLESELERDPEARELLEQMQSLHECSREIVAREVVDGGSGPGELFERAWCRSVRPARGSIFRVEGCLRFATGLAAGFLLGLAVHFALIERSPTLRDLPIDPPVAQGFPADNGRDPDPTVSGPEGAEQVIRQVDWYGFTDDRGNHWLIEGLREDIARPAAYYTGL